MYKNRSSRKIDFQRLFSREYDFTKTFSLTENQFSGKTYFYTIASSYTFSSIEKDEYTKLYEYLKSKKVSVRTAGKGSGAKGLSFVDVDHHLEKVKKDALSDMEDSGSMSSDDSEFNPDALEALSAKEEYDSEPTTTSSDESEDDFGSGSDAERKREEKRSAKKERRIQGPIV